MKKIILIALLLQGCSTMDMEEVGESVIVTVPFVAAAVLLH